MVSEWPQLGWVATRYHGAVLAVTDELDDPQEDVMFGRSRPKWREVAEQGPRRSASEVLEFLHPDLSATLASLHEAPKSVAEATAQLLPFGSRAALESLN